MSEQFNKEAPHLPSEHINFKLVPAKNGILWLSQAFDIFKSSPLNWLSSVIIMTFCLLFSLVITIMLPFLLPVSFLLSTIFIGGLILGCRQISNHTPFNLKSLFWGFEKNFNQLSIVGFIYFAGVIFSCVIGLSLSELLGYEIYEVDMETLTNNVEEKKQFLESLLMPILFMLIIMLPLIMAYWFAPALVVFNSLSATKAFVIGFKACVSNIAAFTLFSLLLIIGSAVVLTLTAIIAQMIPIIGVAIQFIIEMALYSIVIISLYCSYQDIFPSKISKNENQNINDNDTTNDNSLIA